VKTNIEVTQKALTSTGKEFVLMKKRYLEAMVDTMGNTFEKLIASVVAVSDYEDFIGIK